MGLVASDTGKAFTPAPAGTHVAICCQVVDLGTQFSQHYNKSQHKVMLGWELPNEKNEDGEPFLVWKRYTVSLNEKSTLFQHLTAWRGRQFTEEERKGFKLVNVVGKPCMLNVTHEERDGNTYATVKAVMALPKGTPVPAASHKQIVFDLDEFNQAIFDTFSDNLKKTIEGSEERKALRSASNGGGKPPPPAGSNPFEDDDSIPF